MTESAATCFKALPLPHQVKRARYTCRERKEAKTRTCSDTERQGKAGKRNLDSKERNRETQRDRQTDWQTDRQTEKESYRLLEENALK